MKKVKIISIIALILLVLNIFWISFFITHSPPHGRAGNPKKVIIEKLQLDEKQTREYEKLIDEHRESIRKEEQRLMLLKNQLYQTLKENENPNTTDSLIAEIGNTHLKIEHIHYRHFQDIKKLCKPAQQHSFRELCNEIAHLFAPPSPRENENR